MNRFYKILSLTLVAFLVATGAYALNVKSVVNNFNTGSTADHEEVIMQVYNATDSTLTSGDVVCWYLTNDDGRSVTEVNYLGQPVAGVIAETISATSWGKMLVYGYHSAVKIPGAISVVTAGSPLFAYGSSDDRATTNTINPDDGKACAGMQRPTDEGLCDESGSANYYLYHTIPNPFGIALDTTTTETTVEAFINCL